MFSAELLGFGLNFLFGVRDSISVAVYCLFMLLTFENSCCSIFVGLYNFMCCIYFN